jgi:hypothetical protein
VDHTLGELVLRTRLNGHLSGKALQAIDFILPSSHENFALNFGVQLTGLNRKDLGLSLRGKCGVHENDCEWSGTAILAGTHSI